MKFPQSYPISCKSSSNVSSSMQKFVPVLPFMVGFSPLYRRHSVHSTVVDAVQTAVYCRVVERPGGPTPSSPHPLAGGDTCPPHKTTCLTWSDSALQWSRRVRSPLDHRVRSRAPCRPTTRCSHPTVPLLGVPNSACG